MKKPLLEELCMAGDDFLYTVFAEKPQLPFPSKQPSPSLSSTEQKHSAGLMRINHVGEVCAQGLYSGAKILAQNHSTYQFMHHSQQEEQAHLAWCHARLVELNAQPSIFNPIFYAGSFALGMGASLFGDKVSLGFVVETERQVEMHLADQKTTLPAKDSRSLEIITRMEQDEKEHADKALSHGGSKLPQFVCQSMTIMAKTMKWIAYRL